MANTQAGDKRASFYKEHFEKALNFNDYIATGNPVENSRWLSNFSKLQLSDQQSKLLKSFNRQLNILVISGIWCGDCSRQCPLLAKIAAANHNIDLRFLDNNENPELRDELRIQGGTRVPVALFLSEDFNEVARFGDRTLSAYRAKASRELGVACDSGLATAEQTELAVELQEWLDQVERAQLILQLSPMLRKRYND